MDREVFDGILRTWLKGIEGASPTVQQVRPSKRELALRREEAEILTRLLDSRTKMLQFVKVDSAAGFIVLIDTDPLSDAFDTDACLRYIEAFQRLREHGLLVNHSGDGQVFHLSAEGRGGAKQIRGKCLGCGRSMMNVGTDSAEPLVWECNNPRCIDSTWHRDTVCSTCGKRPAEITSGGLNFTNFLCEDGHAFKTTPKR
ncbi:hypothetical protein [Frigoriglobus tundricola]|uniref:Uncharacterized protein n=1 Tax=Frigoriglobus tundricola TaxID=2774151 RepID=A0A6M5Z495_9BACT|nr:hypothetical protein [Frigoriglobus tundricola]QJX01069.1 hypothetical protein FTUN_8708 [Frigoriglobus tundricola]